MTFSVVILSTFLVSILLIYPIWVKSVDIIAIPDRQRWIAARVSEIIIFIFIFLMATRNETFGFDTTTYVEIFNNRCIGNIVDNDVSYNISLNAIGLSMLGACDSKFLPVTWILFIVLSMFIFIDDSYDRRVIYISAFLLSLVGVELSSNALRQGLATGFLVAAWSRWPARPILAVMLAIVSVAFHPSMVLTLFAAGLALMSWPFFTITLFASIAGVVFALSSSLGFLLLKPLLAEIQKYLQHPADEVWVRVLTFASVLATLGAPLIANGWSKTMARRDFKVAMRMACTCMPFLILPYFGYRFIYGMFPLILWHVLRSNGDEDRATIRTFVLLLAFNGALLLFWSLASGAMRDTLFYG